MSVRKIRIAIKKIFRRDLLQVVPQMLEYSDTQIRFFTVICIDRLYYVKNGGHVNQHGYVDIVAATYKKNKKLKAFF